jgi:hypothetical protein
MLYIVSVILMISFILSGIFVGLAPNVYRIVEKDFLRKAQYNAKLQGLQYGDLGLRAGVFNVTSDDPNKRSQNFNSTLTEENGEVARQSHTSITIPQVTLQNPDLTINVNVTIE